MLKYIGHRLLRLIPVFLGVTFITFLLLYIAPGDPAEIKLLAQGQAINTEALNATRTQMGLNEPFILRYLLWLKNFFIGDLGVSYIDGVSVTSKLLAALPATLELAGASLLLTLLVSIPLALLAATRQNSIVDYGIRGLAFLGNAIPGFLLALLLIYIFCLQLKWLPMVTTHSWLGLILPTLALSITMTGKYIRQIRAEVLEQLGADYVLSARTRGVKEFYIAYKNVMHNSMVTIITLVGLSVGSLLGGVAIIETIFSWPGLGKLVIDAITARDYPVVQGFVVWTALVYVLVNLLTDISYRKVDPRIIDAEEGGSGE